MPKPVGTSQEEPTGVVGPATRLSEGDLKPLERGIREGDNPVGNPFGQTAVILSTTGHVKSGGKQGGPPSKAQEPVRPIAQQYREGKVKSTPEGE